MVVGALESVSKSSEMVDCGASKEVDLTKESLFDFSGAVFAKHHCVEVAFDKALLGS